MSPPALTPLPFFERFVLAWSCFFRLLFDGLAAARVRAALAPNAEVAQLEPPASTEDDDSDEDDASDEPAESEPANSEPEAPEPPARVGASDEEREEAALSLLALLQREGRLIDFIQQEIDSFGDDEVGAAARVIHSGCRKALRSHMSILPVRQEAEGDLTSVASDESADRVKLTGNVKGKGPYRGTLRHRGWRVENVKLPKAIEGHDPRVVAPAEIEL